MRNRLGFIGTVALLLSLIVQDAHASPVRWAFERYGIKEAETAQVLQSTKHSEMVDVTADVDRSCSATYTRRVGVFTLGIRYPPACAVAAEKIANTVELGLRVLMERWPWLFNYEISIDIPIALEPLPLNCRYLGRARSPHTVGMLALLNGCGETELQSALPQIAWTTLHETTHEVHAARSFFEAGAEWAEEGAAEYLAMKGMEAVDPGFVTKQLRDREPEIKFMNSGTDQFDRAFRLKSNRGKLTPSEVPGLYNLYLGAFMTAEAAGYQPLTRVEGSKKRSMILGVEFQTLVSRRDAHKEP